MRNASPIIFACYSKQTLRVNIINGIIFAGSNIALLPFSSPKNCNGFNLNESNIKMKHMATVSTNYTRPTSEVATSNVDRVTNILHWTYGLVPIVAGADKFANMLTDWSQYLAPVVANIIPAQTFMMIVGIIEIIAGIVDRKSVV